MRAGGGQRFAGHYKTCKARACSSSAAPRPALVTADVKGENGAASSRRPPISCAGRCSTARCCTSGRSRYRSFAAVNAAQPAPIDYFIGPDDNLTVAAFIQRLMGGIGGWGGHKLDGTFEVRIFEAPTGTSVASFTRGDMLGGDIKREPLPSTPTSRRPIAGACPIANWTVQTDLAGGVSATRKAFVSRGRTAWRRPSAPRSRPIIRSRRTATRSSYFRTRPTPRPRRRA
jgi:hypothetical protein